MIWYITAGKWYASSEANGADSGGKRLLSMKTDKRKKFLACSCVNGHHFEDLF